MLQALHRRVPMLLESLVLPFMGRGGARHLWRSVSSGGPTPEEGAQQGPQSSEADQPATVVAEAEQEAGPRRLRSLSEIFGEGEDPPTSSDPSWQGGGAPGGQGPAADAAPQQQRPGDRVISQRFGYAAIGGSIPKDGSLMGVHPRVNPRRLFVPGTTYAPEDLNPFALSSGKQHQQQRRRAPPAWEDVSQYADYKNVGYLEQFLTPAGKMVSRKMTKLHPGTHINLMREIKRARHMGFIAGEARPEKRHLRAVREAEARMMQADS